MRSTLFGQISGETENPEKRVGINSSSHFWPRLNQNRGNSFMKKKNLITVESWNISRLNTEKLCNVRGGVAGHETDAGTIEVKTSVSSTGCESYSSDYVRDDGGLNYVSTGDV
ncbi:MAG TPA: hypothetical protein VM802_20390 [Chitinophaga sp.]|uniref:hypothetical protein n=1 Tax=Chitinophaga sp. TaxID=1869181 RepID=UPI002BECE85E|nr:hypothetical protein [Chitinophaga sp.]HVI47248.1 hypothetical protein [Chitinophaga sp.]